MHTHPACPCCDHGSRECPRCDGAGSLEISEDRLDSRGEHSTREHDEQCDACAGEGRVVCRACDGAGAHPLVGALLASTRGLYARRVVGARLARYTGANDAQRATA